MGQSSLDQGAAGTEAADSCPLVDVRYTQRSVMLSTLQQGDVVEFLIDIGSQPAFLEVTDPETGIRHIYICKNMVGTRDNAPIEESVLMIESYGMFVDGDWLPTAGMEELKPEKYTLEMKDIVQWYRAGAFKSSEELGLFQRRTSPNKRWRLNSLLS